jgi:hypothetical protein
MCNPLHAELNLEEFFIFFIYTHTHDNLEYICVDKIPPIASLILKEEFEVLVFSVFFKFYSYC